jgi:hypothetical protein
MTTLFPKTEALIASLTKTLEAEQAINEILHEQRKDLLEAVNGLLLVFEATTHKARQMQVLANARATINRVTGK